MTESLSAGQSETLGSPGEILAWAVSFGARKKNATWQKQTSATGSNFPYVRTGTRDNSEHGGGRGEDNYLFFDCVKTQSVGLM